MRDVVGQAVGALAIGLALVFGVVPGAMAQVQLAEVPVPGVPVVTAETSVPEPRPPQAQPAVLPVPDPVAIVAPAPAPVPVVQPEGPLSVEISARLAAGLAGVDAHHPLDAARLKQFYELRHFASVWFGGDGATLSPQAAPLRQVVGEADVEGLVPADYHPAALDARLATAGTMDAAHRAEFDLLLTDTLMAYANDLRRGRLPPHVIASEFALVPAPLDLAATVTAALAAPDLPAFLAKLAPAGERYVRLREALRVARGFERTGGWPKVSERGKSEGGKKGTPYKALRQRLVATGELSKKYLDGGTDYDRPLRQAVQLFQQHHGIKADGVLNSATYAALNAGVSMRVAAILANMERERWMPEDLGRRYVLVNIPDFTLAVMEDGKVTLEMPVIVGTRARRTPILASQIVSLIWNPTWSVPRKLAREDILPKLRANPGYLNEHNMVLYSGSFGGARVDPTGIDWMAVNDISRYRVRQRPGTHNALGKVKFNIPNDFDVYLHDTPHREKFAQSVRAFSSGCVRVGNPLGLAALLLGDMAEWTPERRAQVLEKGATRLVDLRSPIPVFLLYQTAWVDAQGGLNFRDDVYGRDTQMLRALHRLEEAAAREITAAAAAKPVVHRRHRPAPVTAPGAVATPVSATAPAPGVAAVPALAPAPKP